MNPELIAIPIEHLRQIKSVLAYPLVSEILQSDNDLKEYAVYPALRKYFVKFPIRSRQQIQGSGYMEIPYPDDNTFGLTDRRAVDKNGTQVSTSTYSFLDIIKYQKTSSFYAQGNPSLFKGYNLNGTYQALRTAAQNFNSEVEDLLTTDIIDDKENRIVQLYSTSQVTWFLEWAKASNNFMDVLFMYQEDVTRLAQAYAMKYIADFAGISSNNEETVTINVERLESNAKDIFEEIKEKWDQITDPVSYNFS